MSCYLSPLVLTGHPFPLHDALRARQFRRQHDDQLYGHRGPWRRDEPSRPVTHDVQKVAVQALVRCLPGRVVDGTQPELEVTAVVAGEVNRDVDKCARLVLARNDAPSVLTARLVVTWSLPGVAAHPTTAAVSLKHVLKK